MMLNLVRLTNDILQSHIDGLFSVGVQETNGYIQKLVGYFKQYTAWVKNSVSIPPPTYKC